MGDFSGPMRGYPAPARTPTIREDCWTEEATATLINVWGKRYLELNRGNLRQMDWMDVARAVNLNHAHSEKQTRTDIQCKNRIDTIKKKYKVEKTKDETSSWRFFQQLDELIGPKQGDMVSKKMGAGGSGLLRIEGVPRGARSGIGGGFGTGSASGTRMGSPPLAIALRKEPIVLPEAVPVTPLRRRGGVDDSYFRRNYSAMAAAAAKEEVFEDDEDEEGTEDEESWETGEERGKQVLMDVDVKEMGGAQAGMDGARMIALAIEKFAATYEKVETEKLRQFKQIEQRRIDAVRDVEIERTKLLMNTQVQLEKRMRKNAKKKSSGLDDICSS